MAGAASEVVSRETWVGYRHERSPIYRFVVSGSSSLKEMDILNPISNALEEVHSIHVLIEHAPWYIE